MGKCHPSGRCSRKSHGGRVAATVENTVAVDCGIAQEVTSEARPKRHSRMACVGRCVEGKTERQGDALSIERAVLELDRLALPGAQAELRDEPASEVSSPGRVRSEEQLSTRKARNDARCTDFHTKPCIFRR